MLWPGSKRYGLHVLVPQPRRLPITDYTNLIHDCYLHTQIVRWWSRELVWWWWRSRRQICHRLLYGRDKRDHKPARDLLHECCRKCDAAEAGCRGEEFGGSVSWRLRKTLFYIPDPRAGCARSCNPLQQPARVATKQYSGLELRVFGGPFSSTLDPAGWAYVRRAQ